MPLNQTKPTVPPQQKQNEKHSLLSKVGLNRMVKWLLP